MIFIPCLGLTKSKMAAGDILATGGPMSIDFMLGSGWVFGVNGQRARTTFDWSQSNVFFLFLLL